MGMPDLKAELMEIKGVGEATAETILEVLEATESNEAVRENLQEALDYLEIGRPDHAKEYVEQAVEEL